MIISIAVLSLGEMLEAVRVELTQKARVTLVAKVLFAYKTLEHDRHIDAERAPMGCPADILGIFLLRKNMVNLLGERHVFGLDWFLMADFRRDRREVSV